MGLFTCFAPPRDAGWGAPGFGDGAAASARARLLDVVEEEVEERYCALGPLPLGASAARASHDAAFMRRLYKANLPAAEMARAKDLLRKLAALDAARAAAETEQQTLAGQLKAAEAAHRQAEFARARAEAIATARGEALMHAQQATREAELAQAHMEEVLQLAIDRLGIELTPGPSGQAALSPLITPVPAGGEATTPAAVRQSIFSEQQLAAVAASLNKLPRQAGALSWRGGDVLSEGGLQVLQRVSEEAEAEAEHRARQQQRFRASLEREAEREAAERAAAAEAQRAQRRASRRGSEQGSQREAAAAAQLRRSVTSADQGLSGFTVYTNSLQAAEENGPEGVDAGEVAQPPPGMTARHSASAPASVAGGERDSQGSGVQWRSISSAALSTHSLGSLEEEGQEGGEEVRQRGRQPGRASLPGSRAGSQVRQQLDSLEAAAASASWDQEQAGRLQAYAKQLSKLTLPGLDASQLDSLVRIGASQQSPDPHQRSRRTSADVSVQPPVGQWDSTANPLLQLQSEQEGNRLLRGARGEWQQQGGSRPPSRPPSRPGSRRPSQDGAPVAQSMAAAVGRPQQSTAVPRGPRAGSEPPVARQGPRAGSEPPPMLQVPVFDGKVPGAGTWVSPSLAAMIAHKKGHNPLLDGGEPSLPSHIKAVFATNEDREFYGPMAAHLNKRDGPPGAMPPPPPRPPTSTSAESIRGPARQQPPSNRSSLEGGSAEWEARQLAAASQDASLAQQQQAAAVPDRRQAVLASRFQPMGQHVSGPPQQAPRRSSVAVSQLGGAQQTGDENGLAASALGRSTVRASGLPPRHAGGQGQQVPPTKRSMDSLRGSVGGAGPAGQNIKDSLSAVEAAMAALRDANPHLSQQHAAVQAHAQSQPLPPQAYGRASAAAAPSGHPRPQHGAAARPTAHHTRTRSLPESSLDLPLTELSSEEHQRRRQAAAAAQQAQYGRSTYRQ